MYEIVKTKFFYWTLKVLSITFSIPSSLEKSYLRKFFIKNAFVKILCLINFVVLPFYHMVSSIKNHTGVDISENITLMCAGSGTVVTSTLFTFQYEKWSAFYIDLEKYSQFVSRAGLERLKKKLNFYSVMYSLYLTVGLSVYAIVTASETSSCYRLNEENGLNEMCGTLIPLKLPFEVNSPLARAAIFAWQFFLAYICVPNGGLICFMTYEVTEVVIYYIQHLKALFVQVFDVTDEERRIQRLRFCIYYHEHMLRLATRLNALVKWSAGHMSLIGAIVFGTIENQALKSKPLGALVFLIGYMSALFFVCHAGQRMLDESLSVNDAIYESRWYDCDARTMKDVSFIMARCQVPQYLDALPLGTFNYPLFLLVVKTSYTYLTLLRQST